MSTVIQLGLFHQKFHMPWEPGDNVVFPDNEFPANIYPWTFLANRGVEPRRVPLPDGKLTAAALEPYIDN